MSGRRKISCSLIAAFGVIVATVFLSKLAVAEKDAAKTQDKKETKSQFSKEAPPEKLIITFMKAKLDASKDVLDGVVTENYLKIKNGAEKLLSMSKAAEWNAIQGPVYAQYSTEFRRSVERLMKEADDKDIDGAGLAYMQVTMNCISCHKYVKGTQIAEANEPIIRQLSHSQKSN